MIRLLGLNSLNPCRKVLRGNQCRGTGNVLRMGFQWLFKAALLVRGPERCLHAILCCKMLSRIDSIPVFVESFRWF